MTIKANKSQAYHNTKDIEVDFINDCFTDHLNKQKIRDLEKLFGIDYHKPNFTTTTDILELVNY